MVITMDAMMAQVLTHLNSITSYLRDKGQPTAANDIGKLSVEIVEIFSRAVTELELNSYVNTEPARPSAGIPADNELEPDAGKILQLQSQDEFQIDKDMHLISAENWAKIAGHSELLSVVTDNQMAQGIPGAMSCSYIPSTMTHQGTIGRQSFVMQPTLRTVFPSMVKYNGHVEGQRAGVVYLHGNVTVNSIRFITSRIHEGALQEIKIESGTKTRIIFQHLDHAIQFVERIQEEINETGSSCFGRGYTVKMGLALEWNGNLRRMNYPSKERRRLTFARQKLFAGPLAVQKWEQDVAAVAGAENIDFTWVFNSGNATAVFRSTVVARKVLQIFLMWKKGRNVYQGVDVSFSCDPCEKELSLSTQMKMSQVGSTLSVSSQDDQEIVSQTLTHV